MSHKFTAFKSSAYRYYFTSRLALMIAYQIFMIGVAQYVYESTKDPVQLGYVGLALFLPRLLLSLPAGQLADRFSRLRIVTFCRLLRCVTIISAVLLSNSEHSSIFWLFACLVTTGTANAFEGPAMTSLIPRLVPIENFQNAVTWNSSAIQWSQVLGPALGGIIYALSGSPTIVFAVSAVLNFLALFLVVKIKLNGANPTPVAMTWNSLLDGIKFIRSERVILALMSLDLFAVLFGGSVALLPFYANEILHVGPEGLGFLRACPAIGAALMAIPLASKGAFAKDGVMMLKAVIVFGLATIVFAFSTHLLLTVLALLVMGAADMVSMVIRGVVIQLRTPDELRGRVNSVNAVFIGASNELGEFESGVTAGWFGVVRATAIGGLLTLGVALTWRRLFPELTTLKNLDQR